MKSKKAELISLAEAPPSVQLEGHTGNIIIHSFFNGQKTKRQLLTETSEYPPAIVEFKNDVVVAWSGTVNHWLNLIANFNPQRKKTYMQIKVQGSPKLICDQDDLFVYCINLEEMSVIVLHSTDGLTWSDPVRLTEKFHSMPAVVIHQHKLCFAWQDSDNRLNTLILQFDQGKCKITNREKPADGLTGSPQFYSYLHHLWVAYPTKNVLNTLLVSLNPQCDNKYTSQYEVLDALMTDSEKSNVNYKP